MTYSYIAEISAVYQGNELSMGVADKSSYAKQEDGSYLFNQSAKAKIRVKNPVATITITRLMNLNKGGESNFVLDSDEPVISWASAGELTRVEIKDAEGNSYQPTTDTSFEFPRFLTAS